MIPATVTTDSSRSATVPVVRDLAAYDVAVAADLHHQCLPEGFFAKLGVPFLNTYYGCFARSPWAVCLLAEVGGRPAGILVGATDSWQNYRFLARRCGWRLALSGLPALATRPGLALWFMRTRFRRYARGLVRLIIRRWPRPTMGSPTPSAVGSSDQEGLLVHIAVAPGLRRNGVGRALVEAFQDAARTRGVTRLRLLASADDESVGLFYESMGWRPGGQVVDADSRRWTRFARHL